MALIDDEKWMRIALEEAKKAFSLGEVPIGAVLVYQDQILAVAHNQIESLQDPSAHAELLCLRRGANVLGNWRLLEATLYSTLEPCLMCAGAMIQARLKRLVWAAPDLRQGAHGSHLNVFEVTHPIHNFPITSGVLAEEAGILLKEFFKRVREKKALKENFFQEPIEQQKQQVERTARQIIPHVTGEDVLQPNDFPLLENNPHFRYEEGILHGLLSAQAAYLSKEVEKPLR